MGMEKKEKPSFEEYFIFQTGGKQYQAIPGKTVAVEKIGGRPGDIVEFNEVLFRKSGQDQFDIGRPYVKDLALKASIVKQTKGPKITVFRFKRRKKYRVKKGHRQQMTILRVQGV